MREALRTRIRLGLTAPAECADGFVAAASWRGRPPSASETVSERRATTIYLVIWFCKPESRKIVVLRRRWRELLGCGGAQTVDEFYNLASPSYTGVLEYKLAPRQMVYATVRTGCLVGGFNNQVYVPGGFAQVFAPEKVTDGEAGLKSDWTLLDRPIRTNLDVFMGKYRNQQRVQNGTTSEGTTVIAVQNAGRSSFHGADVEVDYNITHDLILSVAYQYIHAVYDQYHAPLNIPGVNNAFVDFAGYAESQTPAHTINFSATYNLNLPANYGDVSATMSYFWRSATTGHDAPTVAGPVGPNGELLSITTDYSQYDALPAFGLVNFSLDWNHIMGSRIDVKFWAKNLMNRVYPIYNSNQLLQYGYATYTYGNPREIGMTVRYSF